MTIQQSGILFNLIRIGLSESSLCDSKSQTAISGQIADWKSLIGCSFDQNVAAITCDGWQALSQIGLEKTLDFSEYEDLRYEWFCEVLNCESEYCRYTKTVHDLIDYLENNGAGRILLLKGYSCSINYPVPSHRSIGDIDIYSLDGKSQYIDSLLSKFPGYSPISFNNERHSHAYYYGIPVENHYSFTGSGNRHSRYSLLEKKLKEELLQSSNISIEGSSVYIPSPTFNAMFLMWHLSSHIKLEQITLRQLCDWWMFLRKESENVNWDVTLNAWKSAKLNRLAAAINGILINAFGMDASLVPDFKRNTRDEERLVGFIFNATPVKTSGIESALKYYRRRWNFALAGDCWIVALLRSLCIHVERILYRKYDYK